MIITGPDIEWSKWIKSRINGSKGCFESEALRKETKRLLSSVEVDFPLDKIIQSKVRKKIQGRFKRIFDSWLLRLRSSAYFGAQESQN